MTIRSVYNSTELTPHHPARIRVARSYDAVIREPLKYIPRIEDLYLDSGLRHLSTIDCVYEVLSEVTR
jgi:hypothetical protein